MPLSPAIITVSLLLLGCVSADSAAEETEFEKDHEKEIDSEIDRITEGEPDTHLGKSARKTECDMSSESACPISELHERKPVLIFPGGKTSCIDDGTKYAFRVYPGDPDKLLVHFQGGGACWDEMTTSHFRACKDNLGGHPTDGMFNRSDPRNPLRSHTVVMVVYCSGDLHIGDTAREYGDIVQRGYQNAMAAIDWAAANFGGNLRSFVVAGCSAGCLAAQAWASTLLSRFKYDHAAFIFDSYLPVFPADVEGHLFINFGTCSTPLVVDAGFEERCSNKRLTLADMLEDAIKRHPFVTFAQLNSKADATQQYFGKLLAQTLQSEEKTTDSESYLTHANSMLRTFNKYPNFVSFLVAGDRFEQHCFVGSSELYSITVNGTSLPKKAEAVFRFARAHQTIAEWMGDVISVDHAVRSDCFGKRSGKDGWEGTAYCDEEQLPKTIRGNRGSRSTGSIVGLLGFPGLICSLLVVVVALGLVFAIGRRSGSAAKESEDASPLLKG
jgi:hypothetical protein